MAGAYTKGELARLDELGVRRTAEARWTSASAI